MALTTKQSRELKVMMADLKAAKELEAAMLVDGPISARTKKVLDIAVASKKIANDLVAQILVPTGQISVKDEYALNVAAASHAEGDALDNEIES